MTVNGRRQWFGISGYSFGPDPLPQAGELAAVTFTISERALTAIDQWRNDCEATDPGSAAILALYWVPARGEAAGHLGWGFYAQAQRAELAPLIQTVSGVELIFDAPPADAALFDGKVLDYSPERRFFFRNP